MIPTLSRGAGRIVHVLLTLCCLSLTSACAPGLGEIQNTMSAYHVVATTTGSGGLAVNTQAVAIHGEAGATLTITAPLLPDGSRGVVLERVLDEGGTMAWRIQLADRSGESWLKLERVSCEVARAELPELPACMTSKSVSAATGQPEVVERRIYPPE